MFGVGPQEILILVIVGAVLILGLLAILMPYFVYRISVNVSELTEILRRIEKKDSKSYKIL